MRDTLGSLRQYAQDIVEDSSSASNNEYDRWINEAVASVAREQRWKELTAQKSITLASSDNGEVDEPALFDYLIGFTYSDGGALGHQRFEERAFESADSDIRFTRYWFHQAGVSESGSTTCTAHVTSGSKTITADNTVSQTWFVDADVGSRLVVSGHRGIYEVTARSSTTVTIYPDFRGADAKSQSVTVAPEGMRKWYLYTDKDVLFTGTVLMDYQKVHPYLYSDDDPVLFDAPDSIRFRVEMTAARQNKYVADAQRLKDDYRDALRREFAVNGTRPSTPLRNGFGGLPPLFVKRRSYFGNKV